MIRSPLLARADLLRALDCAGDDAAAARRYAGLLGFELQPAVATISGAISVRAVVGPAPATLVEAAARAPLRAPLFAITACRRLEDVPGEDSAGDGVPPLTPADCAPRRSDGDAAPFVPLVRQPRLWPALRRSALETHHAGLDLPRLQRELAGARPLRRLPRRWRSGWGGELVVVWDCAERLQPYQDDFRAIVTDLLRQRGTGGFSVWLVDGSPRELRQRWPEKLGRPGSGSGPAALPDAMPLPAPATRVLILSDAGALAALASPSGRAPANAWTDFARRLAQHGAQAVVWAPLAPRQVDGELTRWADVFCLHPAGGLRRRRGGVANDEQRRAESARLHALRERMLARMAFCVRVEPALLRALRGAGAASAAEPALEALLWTHQPVVGDSHVSRALTPAYLESYRQAFQALPAAEQVQALAAARQVHAWRGRATEAAEASIWQAHACAEAQDECGDRVEEARQWFAALTARATRGSTADAGLRDYARDLLARNGADRRWVAANSAWLSPVWLASGAVAAPSGLRDEDLAQAVAARSDLPELDCRLGVGAQGLLLWRGELPPGPGHSPIGPPLRVKRLQVSDADGPRLLDPAAAPQCVAPLASLAAAGAGLTLFAGRHAWRVAGIERPAWAHEIGRDACGLYADLLVPLPGAAPDDPQAIRQRCRWIEAGHFRMGSPADEPAHLENEAQHEVTLSRGFWLADTACTQALWQAVTGANPSEFQDDVRNPVENVSWRDVQAFLSELNRRMPGLQARLPSEAEWEYACRAGTTTPFSFGDDISPEQVNYNGDSPYAGGEKGLNREKTVPVGSLPANPWGLYEMHGNVWEWCADWYGDYPTAPQLDPTGLQTGGSRVLRGGSWSSDGRGARCALRGGFGPDGRGRGIGFRFAPGQAEPDGATEWLPPRDGAAGAAGRGAASARGAQGRSRRQRRSETGTGREAGQARQAPARQAMSAARPEDWRQRGPASFPPRWASAWGDDRFGLWADLAVAGVLQRLRWIEAGSFQMGDERQPDRQVETQIAAGFWLADTACTQALWLVVVGSNPSQFSASNTTHPGSPQHPVEQVSWNDITAPGSGFLAGLQSFSQGVPPELPTEAEWEYACRAAARTAYSFGDEITLAQVNFRSGSDPAAPVAVKSLPANAWGLYEMHGNVWEWCADGFDEQESLRIGAADPSATLRAPRGGSWGSNARDVRAADRLAFPTGGANQFTGFRFLMRS